MIIAIFSNGTSGLFQRGSLVATSGRGCLRDVDAMWLILRLAPDFKTIADFRRDNGAATSGHAAHLCCFPGMPVFLRAAWGD
jgi:hypothetical protein